VATRTTLRATGDAYTDEDYINRNFGDRLLLTLNNNANHTRKTYIGFSLKSLPRAAIVHEALLKLVLRGDWDGNNTITIRRINERWSEQDITFNNAPGVSDLNDVNFDINDGSGGDEELVDITAMVNNALNGKEWHGVRIAVDNAGDKFFHASESPDWSRRPKLVVEYSTIPDPPSSLAPRGGDAVDSSQPKLSWHTGSQSESQVQVNDIEDMSSPDYDSGWVENTDPEWDLALATSPTFDAIPDNDTRFWRVRIKDEDGNISGWSLTQTFERHTYGTLTITSPPADYDSVDESSPTIIFTFTGRTQTRMGWKAESRETEIDPPRPGRLVWEEVSSNRFDQGAPTTDTSFEVRGIKEPALEHRVTVRVWDQFDRGTAVGESPFVQATRRFLYDPTPGVDPVTSFVATQQTGASPLVDLVWERAAAPDSFDILNNGKIVGRNLDPADVFVSGTSYAATVWSSEPNSANTYKVVATENGVDSTSNPVESIDPLTVHGIWLLAPDDDTAVAIYGQELADMELGETGATFEVLGRPTPIRIIDSVRGREGSVSGVLAKVDGASADTSYRRLMRIKELEPSAYLRLALGTRNFPIVLGRLNAIEPQPTTEEIYEVSFDFAQVGEFEVRARG